MIEVLVTSGIACAFCGIWWTSLSRTKKFNTRIDDTNKMLDKFIKINDLEFMDYTLSDTYPYDITFDDIKKKYIKTSIEKQVGKEFTEKGYDVYHIKSDPGYNSLLHKHSFSDEFFYVLDGQIEVVFDETRSLKYYAGDSFFLKHGVFHAVKSNVESEFIVVAKPPIVQRA